MDTVYTLTMNPAVDLTVTVDHVSPEDKLRAHDVRRDPGGGGVNIARVVGELGGRATAFYLAGGPDGERLGEFLEAEEVPCRPVMVAGDTRQNVIVNDGSSERQYRFILPGPEISVEERRRLLDELMGDDIRGGWLVAAGSLPPGVGDDFYADLAGRCREAGVRMLLDTSGHALSEALETGVELIKPNLRELGQLVGRELSDDAEIVRVAGELVEEGKVNVVLVSLGAGGAVLVADGVAEQIRAPTVPVRSKVGAGDSMIGGLVLKLAQGTELVEAARFGVAAGAAAVMTPGTELCRRDDVERLATSSRRRA